MKKIAIILMGSMAFAHASFYQQKCSSADGLATSANGHVKNEVVLSEAFYGQDVMIQKVVYSPRDIEIKTLKEIVLESTNDCANGMFSSKKITYKKVAFQKADGSLFSDKTVGVSKDLKSVSADLICEMKMNGRGACSK